MKILVGITALAACVSAISTSALQQDAAFIDPGNRSQQIFNSSIIARMQRDLSFL